MSPLAATDYAVVQPSPSLSAVETLLDGQAGSSSSAMNNTNSSTSADMMANNDALVGATTPTTIDNTGTPPNPSSSSLSGTASTSRKNPAAMKRTVSFNEVEVREYARCLGSNPATTHGPPLTIDWKYERKSSLPLDVYEEDRPSKERRSISELQVPSTVREAMLRQHTDCTKQDIAEAVRQTRRARHERQITVAMQNYEPWHLLFESFQRKWARWTKRRPSKKREMEILWEKAQSHNRRSQDDELGTASSSSNSSMNNRNCEEKSLMTSPSSLSQQGEEVLLQEKGKIDSATDEEEEEQHIVGYSGNGNACSHKGFVVVGEDGTSIVADPSVADNFPVQSSTGVGQVIVVQKTSRRKKGLFGRAGASNGNNDINTIEDSNVTTTGDIVEC